MSNYPPGVTDADIDEYFGDDDRPEPSEPDDDDWPPGLGTFLERERAIAYYERFEAAP